MRSMSFPRFATSKSTNLVHRHVRQGTHEKRLEAPRQPALEHRPERQPATEWPPEVCRCRRAASRMREGVAPRSVIVALIGPPAGACLHYSRTFHVTSSRPRGGGAWALEVGPVSRTLEGQPPEVMAKVANAIRIAYGPLLKGVSVPLGGSVWIVTAANS